MDDQPPKRYSNWARASVVGDALTAAVVEDPRTRALFDGWEERVRQLVNRPAPTERIFNEDLGQFVERAGTAPDPSAVLYRVFATLPGSAFAFVTEMLKAPQYAERLQYTLPEVFARDLATREGWEWPERPNEFSFPILAPMIAKPFTTMKGDTIDMVRWRIKQFTSEIEAELAPVERAAIGGRLPGPADRASLARGGRWLYELEIRRPRRTSYDLERELHAARLKDEPNHAAASEDPCRSNVRDGIANARFFLEVTSEGGID